MKRIKSISELIPGRTYWVIWKYKNRKESWSIEKFLEYRDGEARVSCRTIMSNSLRRNDIGPLPVDIKTDGEKRLYEYFRWYSVTQEEIEDLIMVRKI